LKSVGDDPWGVAGRNLLNLHLKSGPILSWAPRKDYDRALAQFKRDLIAKQVGRRVEHHKKAILGLPDIELDYVAGDRHQRMRKDVAKVFNVMWDEIKRAHAARTDRAPGDSIGVASAYRDAKADAVAWERAFPKYYNDTFDWRLATGDEFGEMALTIIFQHMNGLKAPPGFSGHTHGIAADLTTTEKGRVWEVNSNRSHQLGWQGTWLYKWLVENAWKHKFYQLRTETWHWEYHEGEPPRESCYAGHVSVKQRPVKATK
jgi:hypothetical protein